MRLLCLLPRHVASVPNRRRRTGKVDYCPNLTNMDSEQVSKLGAAASGWQRM